MKVATWNVNSLNVRLQHVLDWLERERPRLIVAAEGTELIDADGIADERAYYFRKLELEGAPCHS